MSDAPNLVLQHRRCWSRAAASLAGGVGLGLGTFLYFADKMGTVTSTPMPFVIALYAVSVALLAVGAARWSAARRIEDRIVSGA